MDSERSLNEVMAALRRLQATRASCAAIRPVYAKLSAEELAQRARIIDTVVRTRNLLRSLQTRDDELEGTVSAAALRRAEAALRCW
ncbi:hypothetical protein [Dokdonella sp.]|uniref:hypothetical protein n=1 Tax=Dokdonella sp. TaxID=2291710 RepID=UPI0027B9B545|nr:hypothetical protein [Dokdonella sp.]